MLVANTSTRKKHEGVPICKTLRTLTVGKLGSKERHTRTPKKRSASNHSNRINHSLPPKQIIILNQFKPDKPSDKPVTYLTTTPPMSLRSRLPLQAVPLQILCPLMSYHICQNLPCQDLFESTLIVCPLALGKKLSVHCCLLSSKCCMTK